MDNRASPGDISRILWTGKESSKKMSPGPCGGVPSQLEISHVTSDGVRLQDLVLEHAGPGNRFRRKDLRAGDKVPRSRSAEQSADAGDVELGEAPPSHTWRGLVVVGKATRGCVGGHAES